MWLDAQCCDWYIIVEFKFNFYENNTPFIFDAYNIFDRAFVRWQWSIWKA